MGQGLYRNNAGAIVAMSTVTLERIYEDMMVMKKDIEHIKTLIDEDFEVSSEVAKKIQESRKKARRILYFP